MTKFPLGFWALGLTAVMGMAATSARGEAIINGGFETGDFTGWSVSSPYPALAAVTTGAAAEGTQYADLSTRSIQYPGGMWMSAVATMSQSFSANAGDLVSFQWKIPNASYFVGGISAVLATQAGQPVHTWGTPSDTWSANSLQFVADGEYKISFIVSNSSGYPGPGPETGLWIDDVRWTSAPVLLAGDANRDGTVNDEDATILALHWRCDGLGWDEGDFNGDGSVNDIDASILASHWSETTAAEGVSIPEPGSAVLLVTGAALVGWLRRRQVV